MDEGDTTIIHRKNKGIAPILIVVVLLFGIGVVFLLWPSIQGFLEKRRISIRNPFLTSAIEPWAQADDKLATSPQKPSVEELVAILKDVRSAINTGNQGVLKELLSSQLYWMSTNQSELTQKKEKGLTVRTKVDKSQIEYLKTHFVVLPPIESLEFYEVVWADETGGTTLSPYILEDPVTKKKTKVVYTPWRYKVIMQGTESIAQEDKRQGQVQFVFENNRWKYHLENWLIR